MTTTLTDSQLQVIERESANRSLFARELVVATLSQALPELAEHSSAGATGSTTTTSPEAPSGASASAPQHQTGGKKLSSNQKVKRDQTPSKQSSTNVQTAAGSQSQNTTIGPLSQGLPPNPNAVSNQNTNVVTTLVHSVLPQPMVMRL